MIIMILILPTFLKKNKIGVPIHNVFFKWSEP